uniref:Uncharacterized protein n=1 Tax=Acrobeloides nanus TaxID=290746 RepID=A0A914ECI2_9BILA
MASTEITQSHSSSNRSMFANGFVERHDLEQYFWTESTAIGKVNKFGVWVHHQLSDLNKQTRFVCASDLLARFEAGALNLDSILTGDEKWVLYVNIFRRRQWVNRGEDPAPTAKAGLHPKKCLLSLFWDTEGVVHWELLPKGVTITAEVYCQQLDRLAEALNWLNGKEFRNEYEVKESIQQWIDSKPGGFWVKGITALPDRWAKTIEFEVDYFPDD